MINASLNSRSFKTVNQNLLGQFGVFNIPVALSEIIFCYTFPMHENGRKQYKDKLCHGTKTQGIFPPGGGLRAPEVLLAAFEV